MIQAVANSAMQIGLLEPRYLPSGPQTLKQARFQTHTEKSGGKKSKDAQ